MRISSFQLFARNIENISSLNAQTQQAQQQIASGKRVSSGADDPVTASRILQLESELAVTDQYQRNIDLAENRLQIIDGTLGSIENTILRIQELVVRSGTALEAESRGAIALEIDEQLQGLVDLVNSRDRDGDYIFAGFRSGDKPFVETADGYEYRGDSGVRLVQTSNSSYTAISESGERLFRNIETVNNLASAVVLDANLSDVVVADVSVAFQAQYDAVFGEDFVITFNDVGNVVPAGPNYTVTRRSDGAVVTANQPYEAATGIAFNGLQVDLSGTPVPGDRYVIESTRSRDMLSTIEAISQGLQLDDTAARDAARADALNNLDNIQDTLLRGRARIGARLNTLESTRDTLGAAKLNNQEVLSEIRDLDYAEAVSHLTFLSFVLEATQQSFVKVSNLSLFNFLR